MVKKIILFIIKATYIITQLYSYIILQTFLIKFVDELIKELTKSKIKVRQYFDVNCVGTEIEPTVLIGFLLEKPWLKYSLWLS